MQGFLQDEICFKILLRSGRFHAVKRVEYTINHGCRVSFEEFEE